MITTLFWQPTSSSTQWTSAEGLPDTSQGGTDTWGTVVTTEPTANPTASKSLSLDATISRTAEVKLKVTEHPLETRSKMTDHVILEPFTYTLSGFLADADTSGEGKGTAEENFLLLQELSIAGTLFEVVSPTFAEKSLAIEQITGKREGNKRNTIEITILFKKVAFVDTLQVNIGTAGTHANNFKSTPEETTPEEQEKVASTGQALVDRLSGGAKAYEAKVRTFGLKK